MTPISSFHTYKEEISMNNEKIYANIESMSFYLKLKLNVKNAYDIKKFKFIEEYLIKVYELLSGKKPDKATSKMLCCVHRNNRLAPAIERVSFFSETFMECKACGEKVELKTISRKAATKTINALVKVIINSDSKNDKKIEDINDSIKFLMLYIANINTRFYRGCEDSDIYEYDYEDEDDEEVLENYMKRVIRNLK